ncbi:hypothetical protein KY339_06140 [Candidatus Woesearchaeota archaeon]|nr:hypothetical protein [Candidatus Woesearchaeota archaeon]
METRKYLAFSVLLLLFMLFLFIAGAVSESFFDNAFEEGEDIPGMISAFVVKSFSSPEAEGEPSTCLQENGNT